LTSLTAIQGSWDLSDLVKDGSGDELKNLLASVQSEVKKFEAFRTQSLSPDISAAGGFLAGIRH